MGNPNLQQLPQMKTPKERAQEELTEHGEWIADVMASKLYMTKANRRAILLRLKEAAEMVKEYGDKWDESPLPPPTQQITRKLTVEETTQPAGHRINTRELERAMYGVSS